jgi:hypothetical protein
VQVRRVIELRQLLQELLCSCSRRVIGLATAADPLAPRCSSDPARVRIDLEILFSMSVFEWRGRLTGVPADNGRGDVITVGLNKG